jgi:hypothetical protein
MKNIGILVSHPIGNRNTRAILTAVEEAGLLTEFDTAFAVDPDAAWLTVLPGSLKQEFLRRSYSIDYNKIKTYPVKELVRLFGPKLGFNKVITHETGWASIDAVCSDLDQKVSERLPMLVEQKGLTAVYGYEDCALNTFIKAKELGLTCIYDLPIAYWETGKKLMLEEADRLPEWAITLGGGIGDSEQKLEKKTRELELADVVVGPGSFVMDSIPTWARSKKTIMAPFGSPELQGENDNQRLSLQDLETKKLRVLFVGSMGQRKGLGDLFEAVKSLNNENIELVVMGNLLAPLEFYKGQFPNFTYETGRSHDQVLALMRSCDVFCLPSIVEGRALVMQEAMSQQLPIIITENTGGLDLVLEGQTGFAVPIQSPEKIAEKINWFHENRSQIPVMGKLAQEHAAKYTWNNYGDTVVQSIREFIK